MALNPKFSTGLKNALLDGTDMTSMFDGATAQLVMYSGTQPTDADTTEGAGTVLATIVLPTTNAFAASAVAGAIAKAGTWEDTSADASDTATWFRIYALSTETGASTTFRRIDGTVGTATTDIVINNNILTIGDPIVVDTFSVSIE